jgi:hypothetical protein
MFTSSFDTKFFLCYIPEVGQTPAMYYPGGGIEWVGMENSHLEHWDFFWAARSAPLPEQL